LPIEQVQILMALMRTGERSCTEARNVAQRHLLAVRARIVELEGLERTIAGLVQACDASRSSAAGPSCEAWREAQG
jgi:MerR family transcriptional regulator, copper efflux regulator